ncbi:MAG TPA: hypothetical protein VGI40_02945, partial [Pirellulaceae bacterium]
MSEAIGRQTPTVSHPTVPKARRFPTYFLRFSLRTLLLATVILGLFFGWLGNLLIRARHQRQIVAHLQNVGAQVVYDYELDSSGRHGDKRSSPRGPWLVRALLGQDIYASVAQVFFLKSIVDDDVARLPDLPRLKYVIVDGPGITDHGIEHLLRVRKLRGLNLSETSVSADGLRRLRDAAELEELCLYGAGTTDEQLANIDQLAQLKFLQLVRAKTSSDALLPISRLQKLETLLLYQTPGIDDVALRHISALKHLRRLELIDTAVTDDGLALLASLPALEHLVLRICPITDAGMRHIGELNSLTYLQVATDNVGDAGISHLRNLSSLKILSLS